MRGAINASHAEPGFSLDRSLLVTLDPSLAGIDEARGRAFYARVLERVRALPGVEAASLASVVPFGDFTEGRRLRRVGDGPPRRERPAGRRSSVSYGTGSGAPGDTGDGIGANHYIVGRGYFETLGIPILRGRGFTEAEEQSAPGRRVAVIDEPLAKRLFPDGDALGQHIYFPAARPPTRQPMEVVGIVGGTRHSLFDKAPVPHVFVPFGHRYRAAMNLHVRTRAGRARRRPPCCAPCGRRSAPSTIACRSSPMSTMGEFRDRSLSSGPCGPAPTSSRCSAAWPCSWP